MDSVSTWLWSRASNAVEVFHAEPSSGVCEECLTVIPPYEGRWDDCYQFCDECFETIYGKD